MFHKQLKEMTVLFNRSSSVKEASMMFLLLVEIIFLSLRMFDFIQENAVNILFWDQWDFYTPLFENKSIYELFVYQHGPHRMGIGLLFTRILDNFTAWNTRSMSIALGGLVFIALIMTLILKKRMFGTFSLSDLVIPPMFLTLAQYETFIGTPNPSHSTIPLLLIILYCLAWLIGSKTVSYSIILIINLLLIFTGFGLFIGVVTIVLFIIESYHQARDGWNKQLMWTLIALLVSIFSIGLFAIGYKFEPATECFGFSLQYLGRYPLFIGLMLGSALRTKFGIGAILIGLGLLLLSLAIFFYHFWIIVKRDDLSNKKSLVIAILLGYSLIFSLSTAIGRVCLGLDFAQSSRYITLMIPAILGIYFHILTIDKINLRKVSMILWVLIILLGATPLGAADSRTVNFYRSGKQYWRNCYISVGNVEECNDLAEFTIYPINDPSLEWKLRYLREHGLNLYLDAGEDK